METLVERRGGFKRFVSRQPMSYVNEAFGVRTLTAEAGALY